MLLIKIMKSVYLYLVCSNFWLWSTCGTTYNTLFFLRGITYVMWVFITLGVFFPVGGINAK